MCTDRNLSATQRVSAVLTRLTTLVSDDPEVAAACAIALLGNEPELSRIRIEIGQEVRRLISSALGPEARPSIATTLEMTYSGALLHTGTGVLTGGELADRLETAVSLIVDADDCR